MKNLLSRAKLAVTNSSLELVGNSVSGSTVSGTVTFMTTAADLFVRRSGRSTSTAASEVIAIPIPYAMKPSSRPLAAENREKCFKLTASPFVVAMSQRSENFHEDSGTRNAVLLPAFHGAC